MSSDRIYTPAEMADAVQRMLDDGTYMPWDVLPKLVAYLRSPAPGAAEMREAAASDKFATFGRMVFDATASRFANSTMDETDADNMELAVKAGLAEHVQYDPEKHGDVHDAEPGDDIIWWGAALPAREVPEDVRKWAEWYDANFHGGRKSSRSDVRMRLWVAKEYGL